MREAFCRDDGGCAARVEGDQRIGSGHSNQFPTAERPELVAALKESDTDGKWYQLDRPEAAWNPRKHLEYRLFWPYSSGIAGRSMCHQINAVHWFSGLPHIRLLVDLYHMACMGDTPEDLSAAMDVVAHIEFAEKKNRTIPGVAGDDFRPFFKVLRKRGYAGAINIEVRRKMNQVAPACQELARQAAEA